MSILFAVVFLVLIFKCVGLALRVCGTLLGALLSLAGFLLSLTLGAVTVRTFYRVCGSSAADRNCMARDSDPSIKTGIEKSTDSERN